MRRVLRATGVALLVAAGTVGGGLIGGGVAAAAPDTGLLRLAHLSPDTPAVDVYVDAVADPNAGITLRGVDYGTISDYQEVAPGSYTVSMRTAGAPADTPPVLATTVEVTGQTARTVAGVGLFADLGLAIIDDSLQTPDDGSARIRVLAGASNAPTLDVAVLDGPSVASGLAFASTSAYVDVPAGATTLSVAAGGQSPAQLPVELAAGSVYSLVVLDSDGGLTVEPVLDAAGPGVVPAGGVETGAGGTAGHGDAGPVLLLAVGATVLVAGAGAWRLDGRSSRRATRTSRP